VEEGEGAGYGRGGVKRGLRRPGVEPKAVQVPNRGGEPAAAALQSSGEAGGGR